MDTSKNMKHATEVDCATAIVQRYLSLHEQGTYTYRVFRRTGIYRRENYRYLANLAALLPEAELGTFSYIWGVYKADAPLSLRFALIPFGPVKVYVNGSLVAQSDIFSERFRSKQILELPMQQGDNQLVLECENTSGGFGCEFGTWVGKLDYYFFMPSFYTEQEGLCYSKATGVLEHIEPDQLRTLSWLFEEPTFSPDAVDCRQVFPDAPMSSYVVATTSMELVHDTWCSFLCNAVLLLDDKRVDGDVQVPAGTHMLCLYAKLSQELTLVVRDAKTDKPIVLHNPVLNTQNPYRFLLAGPFESIPLGFTVQYQTPFITQKGLDFWHLEGEDTYLRMYNENLLFGHWNYPLGVTLYGLMETERYLVEEDVQLAHRIAWYVTNHIQMSIDTYAYAMWDKETLGGACAVHHLMTSLDSLDDCGSFASTVLEAAKDHTIAHFDSLIRMVGSYIAKTQPRLPDGTFYRTGLMHEFHENTLWADDLYMSVPFLCRYAAYTGDAAYLEDAVNQFFGFAKYLYMEKEQLMSHVYDFSRSIANSIPWGRGNGWVLFSLSELLMVLPSDHPKQEALLLLFKKLSEGYLRLQDEEGMFHQVLNMPDSYQESSCTAMFACAFSRGVRYGWYDDAQPYRRGCIRACDGLKEKAIDCDGHVHGVCRGSEFSCSKHYYAEQLLPRLDDTHGIGIILLALSEQRKLG